MTEIQSDIKEIRSDIREMKATISEHGSDIREIKKEMKSTAVQNDQNFNKLWYELNRQGVLAEAEASSTKQMLEMLNVLVNKRPTIEEIDDRLDNHEMRIDLVETAVRKRL